VTGAGSAGGGGRGGRSSTTPAPATATTTGGRGGGRGGTTTTTQSGAREPLNFLVVSGPAMYDAELWLVHRRPDGAEHVQLQNVRFAGTSLDYKFPPVQVTTSRGTITIDVTGRLQAIVGTEVIDRETARLYVVELKERPAQQRSADQQQRIMLSINRRARMTGPPLLDINGGSGMLIEVPSPDDVLSFEFPPLQKAAEDLLRGHTFSLRVRLAPVRK
jgi:hypothetical protein